MDMGRMHGRVNRSRDVSLSEDWCYLHMQKFLFSEFFRFSFKEEYARKP